MEFRTLRADEIDVRVATVSDKGVSLLLYKDARCDMNILDETVGSENWCRNHELINGNLFCNVGIKFEKNDKREFGEWVFKQDVGTESYTEKEKGQASDSFKRACFNWGIGRELYTAPFIWFNAADCNISEYKGKLSTNDKFEVIEISYSNKKISSLSIKNLRTNRLFTFGKSTKVPVAKPAEKQLNSKEELIKSFSNEIKRTGKDYKYFLNLSKVTLLGDITGSDFEKYIKLLKSLPDKV